MSLNRFYLSSNFFSGWFNFLNRFRINWISMHFRFIRIKFDTPTTNLLLLLLLPLLTSMFQPPINRLALNHHRFDSPVIMIPLHFTLDWLNACTSHHLLLLPAYVQRIPMQDPLFLLWFGDVRRVRLRDPAAGGLFF